jgi:hypothetical protein
LLAASGATNILRVLLTLIAQDKAIGKVEGVVTSDDEVRKLMLDRGEWRSKIKMIVAANKEEDSSKREHRKIKCIKTRSVIVVI